MWAGSVKFVLSDMKREKCSQSASSKTFYITEAYSPALVDALLWSDSLTGTTRQSTALAPCPTSNTSKGLMSISCTMPRRSRHI
jgi:hypothetical protein